MSHFILLLTQKFVWPVAGVADVGIDE